MRRLNSESCHDCVQKSHGTALRVIRRFWRKLITSEVGFVELSDILSSLSMVEARALKVYRLMLERYPTNVKLLRSYGRFMEEVQVTGLAVDCALRLCFGCQGSPNLSA